MGVLGSSPSCSPSWSLGRRLPPSHPNTRYCLGIHVTLTKETSAVPPPPHTWTVPLVEDMLQYARTGLTEAVVMGSGRAILFYGRQSLGGGLSLGESRDSAFVLTGVGTWVGKPAYLATDPLTIQEGQQDIGWAITECQIKLRGPGHPHVNLSAPQPSRFNHPGDSPQKYTPGDANSDHQLLPHWPPRGQNCNWHRRDQGLPPPQLPSPSMDHQFKSDRSSVLTASSMLSLSDRSKSSWHEHYNNMKALDALNQELFQLWMADKETILDWGVHLSRHHQVLAASFPNCFPPDHVATLKWDCFYGQCCVM